MDLEEAYDRIAIGMACGMSIIVWARLQTTMWCEKFLCK